MRALVYVCFYPLILQRTILKALHSLLRRLPDNGNYDVPKHVGDLITSDVYILLRVMLVI
jgi:hypothetical protein